MFTAARSFARNPFVNAKPNRRSLCFFGTAFYGECDDKLLGLAFTNDFLVKLLLAAILTRLCINRLLKVTFGTLLVCHSSSLPRLCYLTPFVGPIFLMWKYRSKEYS